MPKLYCGKLFKPQSDRGASEHAPLGGFSGPLGALVLAEAQLGARPPGQVSGSVPAHEPPAGVASELGSTGAGGGLPSTPWPLGARP